MNNLSPVVRNNAWKAQDEKIINFLKGMPSPIYVKAVPLLRLPRHLGVFDYLVPDDLREKIKIGQLIEVPFKKRDAEAVVVGLSDTAELPREKLKSVFKIRAEHPLATKEQIDLVGWASEYYCHSPTLFYKTLLPKVPRRAISCSEFGSSSRLLGTSFQIPYRSPEFLTIKKSALPRLQEIIKKIFEPIKISPERSRRITYFLAEKSLEEKIISYLKITERILKKHKQILFIFPHLTDIKAMEVYFHHYFPAKVAVLHGKLSPKSYRREWERIMGGEAKIILGTRQAVFAPVLNLGMVVVDDESSRDHKQWDQNPRYDARKVAEVLASQFGAKMIFCGTAPRVSVFYRIKKNQITALCLGRDEGEKAKGKIVDLKEHKVLGSNILSPPLQDACHLALKNKKKIILFSGRRGESTFIFCKDCGYNFLCPECSLPLVSHEEQFICHYCGLKQALALLCPKCQGSRIGFLGCGTKKIEKEIKKIFPEALVLRADKDANSESLRKELKNFDILITTDFFWKSVLPFLKKGSCSGGVLGIINADSALIRPDFTAAENAFITFQKIKNLEIKFNLRVFIQTNSPDNFVLKNINNSAEFYKQELSERKKLGYPPFVKIIKLIYQDKDQQKTETEAQALYKKLKTAIPAGSIADYSGGRFQVAEARGAKVASAKTRCLSAEISEPFYAYTTKVRGRFRQQIIIRHKDPVRNTASNGIKKLIDLIPEDWLIDIDPVTLL